MHTGYFNILRRSGAGQKETTSENQRFSEVFYGLMDPLVIRLVFIYGEAAVLTVNALPCEVREGLTHLSRL